MKKRLLSLLVAISMVLTFLPVSALTAAAAEDSSNGELKIGQNCYPVLDNIPHQTVNEHDIYTGDGWTYDADENCKILTLCPSAPTNYDFFAIHTGHSITTDCNLVIGKNATVTDGNFIASVTNNDTIKGGIFKDAVTNHGTIIGGRFFSSVTNELDGIIENGQFGDWASSYTVTNNGGTINGGTINGGTFKEMSSIIGTGSVASGYTLAAETPSVFSSVSVNGYHNSCYIIPNQASVSVDISYRFDDTMYDLPPLDVTIDNAPPTLLSDWCGSDLKIEFDDIRGVYEVTFTAPPANGSTVTISPLTRLVIDKDGYPAVAQDRNGSRANYTGNGWKFDASNNTLTLESGDYDFSGEENALRPLNPNVQLVVKSGATLTGGAFAKKPTGEGAGTFKTVTLNGTGSITAVNGLTSGDWGNKLYAVPTGANTITASVPIRDINLKAIYGDDVAKLYPNQSDLYTILLNVGWLEYQGYIKENTNIVLNQGTYSTLKMADDGTPITTGLARISDGNFHTYFGNGWHSQALSGDPDNVYLESGNYNFLYTDPVNKKGENLRSVNCGIVNEGGIIEDGIFNTLVANGQPGSTSSEPHVIEGGTFAAGLLYNDGVITGGAFNGKDSIFPIGTVLSGNYRSVTVKDGAISKVNDTPPLVPGETGYDLVQGSAWDLYSYAGTVLTVESNVDITNINGQKIGNAFSSYYLNGETNKKVVCFEMPDSDVELNSTKIVVPDPKPEPEPDPTPETYTLTVKGGTFTYNGSEAMTSASVPVDAEVKVTLNQSAVPEGMVFDLWAMDEASLLGNPNVAYNAESFTIPAGTVAKDSIVTVEAQYRDATIESEPSILGTAAIIGVAGAGTAVIVWQGYRIGMELYEKYFQPTPEEDAVVEPTLESQMTDPIS